MEAKWNVRVNYVDGHLTLGIKACGEALARHVELLAGLVQQAYDDEYPAVCEKLYDAYVKLDDARKDVELAFDSFE